MSTLKFLARTYHVGIDPATFRAELDQSSTGSPMLLCRVGLTGGSDLDWRKAFCFTQWDSIENFFYRLSEDGKSVCFLAPREEAADNVKLTLRALASFLKRVNANANQRLGAHADWARSWHETELALTA